MFPGKGYYVNDKYTSCIMYYFWNQCIYDFTDLTIQQVIEFYYYVLIHNFKIRNCGYLFEGGCISLNSNQVVKCNW